MKRSFSPFIPLLACCMIIALVVITGCTSLGIPGIPGFPEGSANGTTGLANTGSSQNAGETPASNSAPGSQTCDASTNFSSDNKNCGQCGGECPEHSSCDKGMCPCDLGYEVIGKQCVQSSSSSPDTSSPTGTCDASTNFLTDNKNCGQCGGECPEHSSCDKGVCPCDSGYEVSSDQCVLSQSNVNAPTTTPTTTPTPQMFQTCTIDSDCTSGKANAAKIHAKFICTNGLCNNLTCISGWTNCATPGKILVCVNTSSDSQNCGGCTKPCTGTCTGGACISLAQKVAIRPVMYLSRCSSGLTNCGTDSSPICVNLSSDSQNCGQCKIPCPNGQVCTNKACQTPNTVLIYVPPKNLGNIQP